MSGRAGSNPYPVPRSRKRPLLTLFLTALASYAGICLLLLVFQGRLVYFPGGPPRTTPADHGLDYDELELVTSDGVRIHGWLLPTPEPRGVLLFCHGNAGNIEHRLSAARVFRGMGLSVLLFDYRGYGASRGRPSEEGTYRDAEAAYDHLVGEAGFAPDRIALYGESLGAAVALELAGRREVACVVVESAFTSLPALGAELYRWLPVRLLSRFRYDNARKVGALGVPLMIVHSPADDIVPYAHGERLLAAAGDLKTFLATGGGHNDGGFLQRGEWIERVRDFFGEALP